MRRFYGCRRSGADAVLAEGVGFEPTLRFPVNTLSKRAPSATRPPLRTRLAQKAHAQQHAPKRARLPAIGFCQTRARSDRYGGPAL